MRALSRFMTAVRLGPGMSPAMTAFIAGAAIFTALATGLDYIAIPPDHRQLSDLENAVPLDVWGVYMVFASCVAVAGWASERWWMSALGHAALAGVYLAFGVGVLLTVLTAPDFYGWRPGFARMCIGIVHVALTMAAWGNWDRVRDRRG